MDDGLEIKKGVTSFVPIETPQTKKLKPIDRFKPRPLQNNRPGSQMNERKQLFLGDDYIQREI